MFPQLFGTMSNVGQAYQMLALGNYGYGVYSQDVKVRRDRFTGQANVERELEFVPLGPSMFGPSGGLPLGLHQTYYSEGVDIPIETCGCLF
jgi:hypothetical protein